MNKTTSSRQGTPAFWPGTNIVKSTGNAFTLPARTTFVSPSEQCKATKHAKQLDNSNEAQKARGTGFGHVTLDGLSKRGTELLKNAPRSITIAPRDSSQGARIKKGRI